MRRRYGAIIVENDEIISTGYNGAPGAGKTALIAVLHKRKYEHSQRGTV
jgi:deoxycytidylate deaminase